tara:strand:- start:4827 stop:5330 length:504 start_codon:yes stop_codon:yes gene_type:complete
MLTKKKLRVLRNAVKALDILDDERPSKVVFTTQNDNRVDDVICLQLSGVAFAIDDPARPIIPIDTHPRCRCYYVDEQTGQVVTDLSSKRDVKRRSELTDRQRKNLIKKDKQYLTLKKRELIEKNVTQQNKYLSDKQFKKYEWQFDLEKYKKQKSGSAEIIHKWLDMI